MNHRQKKRRLLARVPHVPKELLILLWPRRHGKATYAKGHTSCNLGAPWEVGILERFRFINAPDPAPTPSKRRKAFTEAYGYDPLCMTAIFGWRNPWP